MNNDNVIEIDRASSKMNEESELYEMAVLAKRALIHKLSDKEMGLDLSDIDKVINASSNDNVIPMKRQWSISSKIAAAFAGLIIVSGITVASVHVANRIKADLQKSADTVKVETTQIPTVKAEPTETEFDNETLEYMMTSIAKNYKMEIVFTNDNLKSVRVYYVFDRTKPIEKVIKELNHFKKFVIKKDRKTIYVTMP